MFVGYGAETLHFIFIITSWNIILLHFSRY